MDIVRELRGVAAALDKKAAITKQITTVGATNGGTVSVGIDIEVPHGSLRKSEIDHAFKDVDAAAKKLLAALNKAGFQATLGGAETLLVAEDNALAISTMVYVSAPKNGEAPVLEIIRKNAPSSYKVDL